jgi:hypothetical protein
MTFLDVNYDNFLIIKCIGGKVEKIMPHNAKLPTAVKPADKQKNISRRGGFSAFPEASSTVRAQPRQQKSTPV